MLRFVSVGILFVVFAGCSTTIQMATEKPFSTEELNSVLKNRRVHIRLDDHAFSNSVHAQINQDSIYWTDAMSGRQEARPFGAVREIYYERIGRGLLVGMVVGATGGLAIALTPSNSDSSDPTDSVGESWADSIKPIAIVGLIITSSIIGSLAEGSRRVIIYRK